MNAVSKEFVYIIAWVVHQSFHILNDFPEIQTYEDVLKYDAGKLIIICDKTQGFVTYAKHSILLHLHLKHNLYAYCPSR